MVKLHDKGYINLSFSDSKLRNNTTLEVTLPMTDHPEVFKTQLQVEIGIIKDLLK
ncbi:hypothetical protein CV093_10165 [Oceanobacillus sp. 143]|nr:hypothetical protein CV093_10165 [Oceanobacillus sp. 143]